MALDILGKVGPQFGADGTSVAVRQSRDGAVIVQAGHARFQEAVLRGNVFLAANQAGKAVTNLNATATGFILHNPTNSGKHLVLLEITFIQTSTAAATANAGLMLAANVNPAAAAPGSTTALIVRNALIGNGSAGAGLAYSDATLAAAPVAVRQIWQPSVSATATTDIPPMVKDEVGGIIIVAPGCTISLSALSALSGAAGMVWEEIPV